MEREEDANSRNVGGNENHVDAGGASGQESVTDFVLSSFTWPGRGSLDNPSPHQQTESGEEMTSRARRPCLDESAQVDLELSLYLPYGEASRVEDPAPARPRTQQTARTPYTPALEKIRRMRGTPDYDASTGVNLELSLSSLAYDKYPFAESPDLSLYLPYGEASRVEDPAPARPRTQQTAKTPYTPDLEKIRRMRGTPDYDASTGVNLELSLSSLAYDKYPFAEESPDLPRPPLPGELTLDDWQQAPETRSIIVTPRAVGVNAPPSTLVLFGPSLDVHPTSGTRRRPEPSAKDGTKKGDKLERPPFPWATDRRATVHSISHLLSQGVTTIDGEAACTACGVRFPVSYDLWSKFAEVTRFIAERMDGMRDRAPAEWMKPAHQDCTSCNQSKTLSPVISAKKRSINWLFLFLGQGIGFCSLRQLKYFCKHTKNHRTGAKDRLVYLTYIELYRQLSSPS